MEQLKILAGDGVFVTLAQKALIVGAFQILELGGVTAEFLIVTANRARILHAAMNHFFLAIALDLERDGLHDRTGGDDHHRDHEKQGEQNVPALGGIAPAAGPASSDYVRVRDRRISHCEHFLIRTF